MTRDPVILACLFFLGVIAIGVAGAVREIAAVAELEALHMPADVRLDP